MHGRCVQSQDHLLSPLPGLTQGQGQTLGGPDDRQEAVVAGQSSEHDCIKQGKRRTKGGTVGREWGEWERRVRRMEGRKGTKGGEWGRREGARK